MRIFSHCGKRRGLVPTGTPVSYTHLDVYKRQQRYQPHNCAVEGDYSQAAFFFVANALGSRVALTGLREDSLQGDREILPIIKKMGTPLAGMEIDVSQIPDLVPVLAVLATQAEGCLLYTSRCV